jgi:hypothetical protein
LIFIAEFFLKSSFAGNLIPLLSLLVFVVFLFRAVNSSAVFVKVDDPFLVFVIFASSSDFDSSTTLAAPPKSFLPVIVDLSNPDKK